MVRLEGSSIPTYGHALASLIWRRFEFLLHGRHFAQSSWLKPVIAMFMRVIHHKMQQQSMEQDHALIPQYQPPIRTAPALFRSRLVPCLPRVDGQKLKEQYKLSS